MLELYILETCPYCRKVMDYMCDNDISFKKFDVSDSKNMEMLIKLGGERQVPFLDDTVNKVSMYESDDIIKYVKSHK